MSRVFPLVPPRSNDELELLTPEEVAELLKVPLSWVYSRTRAEKDPLPHRKVGHYTRLYESEVRQWLDRPRPSTKRKKGLRKG